jgi:ATP-dependent DNA ligase
MSPDAPVIGRRPRRRPSNVETPDPFLLPLDTPPMEAALAEILAACGGPWEYEPKWDGFCCLCFKAGGRVEMGAKSGKPLGRYLPEVVAAVADIAAHRRHVLTRRL